MELKSFMTLLYFFIIILIILMITVEIVMIYKSSYDSTMAKTILDNHKYGIIQDITFDENCKEKNKIVHFSYPGTVKGCKCPLSLKKEECSKDDSLCYNVQSTFEEDLTLWKKETLCVKRNSLNYRSLWKLSVAKDKDCETGFKKCGILDSTNNILCIDRTLDCPVNYIALANMHETNTLTGTNLQFSNSKYLDFSKKYIENAIPLEFKIYEENVCSFSSEVFKSSKSSYKLDNNGLTFVDKCSKLETKYTSDAYEYDSSFTTLDQENKYELFYDNNIYHVVNNLPGYPVNNLKDINIFLSYRSYIGISKECHASYASPELLELMLIGIKDFFFIMIFLLIISILLLIMISITLSSYKIMRHYLIRMLISTILIFGLVVIIKIYINIQYDVRLLNCLDNFTASVIGYLFEAIESKHFYSFTILYIIYAIIALLFLTTVLLLFMNDAERDRLFEDEENKDDYVKIE